MAVIVDLSCVCDAHTDAALEYIFKAQGEDPPGDAIWAPIQNPYIRRLVELFTQRGLHRIAGLRGELDKWVGGQEWRPEFERPARPSHLMERWSPTEIGLTKLYLESVSPDEFTMDDWLMLIDYLVQRYLPADDMRTEAEWLVTRAGMMGRVQAALKGEPNEETADRLLAAIPPRAELADKMGLKPTQRAILDYGVAHCAENVTAMAETSRLRLRRAIMDYSTAKFLGDKTATAALQSRLFDEFAAMNRDWRRIAVTEAGESLNQGVIANLKPGTRVRRVEKYIGACAFCRSIDGKTLTVAAPDDPDKDGDTQVWVGKTNIGRAASPRKRAGGELVEREPHELWWVPAGTVHPHCRGSWFVLSEPTRKVDPKFSAWMDEVLAAGRK